MHEYPIDLVLNLHEAALANQRLEMKSQALGLSMAVLDGLDRGFNQGAGKVLETWFQALDGAGKEEKEAAPDLPLLPAPILAWFTSLPVKGKPS